MRKTRIVVPCYNEAARLDQDAFLRALEEDRTLSFLFVNDGSKDATEELLESLRRKDPERIDVLNLEKNAGKAEAVRRGMVRALEGEFAYLGYWDADLATPLEAIAPFCRVLDAGDDQIVIGARVRLLGKNIERRVARHYLGRVFATCASLLLRIGIYDTQCGAKLFRASPVLKLVFGRPFKVNWTFDVEMFARFSVITGKCPKEICSNWVEYPLERWRDVKGSKIKGTDFIWGGLELLKLFCYLYTPKRSGYKEYLCGEAAGSRGASPSPAIDS